MRVALDLELLDDLDGARVADASEVVAREVDEHEVLGALLLVRSELGGERVILGAVCAALARELEADEKERAEHLMLVDLARNDLGRVCDPGSVAVVKELQVERYSHIMHLVSQVEGRLRAGEDGFSLLEATFPAGTVSGAPKVRAMQIISELEQYRRGPYAGAVLYSFPGGPLDACIAIRTVVLHDGVAHLQAGAGIVADSDPRAEHEECLRKLAALESAIDLAEAGG